MTNPQLLTGLGAALSIFLASSGSCAASVPAGLFALRSTGIQGFFPVIISGVLAIYGCIISVILSHKVQDNVTETDGYRHFAAGLSVGLACLASGLGMAKFVDAYMKSASDARHPVESSSDSMMEQPLLSTHVGPKAKVTLRFIMVLVFIEAIALYGLIVALLLAS